MQNTKFVKIHHFGPILPLSGIHGPVEKPIRLNYDKISEMLDMGYGVTEVIKNFNTGEVLGEVTIDKTNYNKNNFSQVGKQKNDDEKSQDVILDQRDEPSITSTLEPIAEKQKTDVQLNEGGSEEVGLADSENRSKGNEMQVADEPVEEETKTSETIKTQQPEEEEFGVESEDGEDAESGEKKGKSGKNKKRK